uniref:Uncharacterized protein n=1 Tax=Globodera rostochiensis TaxID=31243 RepID=A0A914H1Z5_GLORO
MILDGVYLTTLNSKSQLHDSDDSANNIGYNIQQDNNQRQKFLCQSFIDDNDQSNGTNTTDDGTNTTDDGTNTDDDGTNTDDDGTNTDDDGTNNDYDGTNNDYDGTNTADDGTNNDYDGTNTADDGTNNDYDGTNTADDGTNTDNDGTNTDDDGTNTDNDGTNTDDDGTNTDNDGTNNDYNNDNHHTIWRGAVSASTASAGSTRRHKFAGDSASCWNKCNQQFITNTFAELYGSFAKFGSHSNVLRARKRRYWQ